MCDHTGDPVQTFYAISVPEAYVLEPDTELIFQDRVTALKAAKGIKGSRFNCFSNYQDAIGFSHARVPPIIVIDKSQDGEKSSQGSFPALHPRELAILRKAIEKGDSESLKVIEEKVWSNPSFLISRGDSAVALMEGPKYNAAHIACKSNKGQALKLILETITNKEFVKKMYPKDSDDTMKDRMDVLLDSYLNTPEKVSCDTPLHLASKFASVSCIENLLSYPECNTSLRNKFDKAAVEVICERKFSGDEQRHKIEELFERRLYIPIFRKDDGFVEVGEPINSPPANIGLKVEAFAGPMSTQEANELCTYIKSPIRGRESPQIVRLTDHRKGVERLSRTKCRELKVAWVESWPFLNRQIDLCTDEGLECLEAHFRKITKQFSPDDLISALENLDLHGNGNDDENDELYYTAPSTPNEMNQNLNGQFYVEGSEISHWDFHAYTALKDRKINYGQYPLIADWITRISTIPPSTPTKTARIRLSFNTC